MALSETKLKWVGELQGRGINGVKLGLFEKPRVKDEQR